MHALEFTVSRYGLALLAVFCVAGSLSAQQRSGLGYIPGGYRRSTVEQASYPCPHDGPSAVPQPSPDRPPPALEDRADEIPDPANDAGVPADDYAPEVADLGGEAAFASASQSAAPNMIGDTIGYGGTGYISFGGSIIPFSPGGGRKFKASTNQSPVPEQRCYYNFHWFEDPLIVQGPGVDPELSTIDVTRSEFGWEWLFWNGMMSAQIQLPLSNSIDSTIAGFDLDGIDGVPDFTDTELGNIALALKGLLYCSECYALSLGLAVDLPTTDDVLIQDNDFSAGSLSIETDAVTLSPFVGYVYQSPCRWFTQGFVQVAIPLNENDYLLATESDGIAVGELEEATLLYADCGVGFWFYNSDYDGAGCCGKGGCGGGCCDSVGVAGIVEVHYTTTLDDDSIVDLHPDTADTFEYSDFDWINLSLGLAAHHNCWSVTPAVVVPLREAPDRQFDVEFTVQVNRRY